MPTSSPTQWSAATAIAAVLIFAGCGGSGTTTTVQHPSSPDLACEATACDPDVESPVPTPDSIPPAECGGASQRSCPERHACIAADGSGCDPAADDACPGTCVPRLGRPSGCGTLAGPVCERGQVCVDDPDDDCEGGPAVDCPGICVDDAMADCRIDDECSVVRGMCTECADGSWSCPESRCVDGACVVELTTCPDPRFCGGFAGFPCPRGYVCLDDPSDDCDPAHGGADCGGVCVPIEQAPPDCWTEADCSVPAGPCWECRDGSYSCPEAKCVDGMCEVEHRRC